MKIEWLVANEISVGSPARVEHGIFGVIFDVFWLIQAAFMVGEPICDVRIPS